MIELAGHEAGQTDRGARPRQVGDWRRRAPCLRPAAPRSGPGTTTSGLAMPPRPSAFDRPTSATADWTRARHCWCSAPASRTRFPQPHPVVDEGRAAKCPVIGDVELLLRAQPRGHLRRHHRHQRQIDDDGSHRPYPGIGRPPGRGRRQYRHAGARPGTARRRRHLRARAFLLPARADALARASRSPCSSTSPRIISTATAAWRAMSPPSAVSSAHQAGKTAVVGIDDEASRAIYSQLVKLGDRRVVADLWRASARRAGSTVSPASCSTTWRRRSRECIDLRTARQPFPARITGRTPPLPMPPVARSAFRSRRDCIARHRRPIPVSPHRQELVGGDRRQFRCDQRQQGDQRRRHGQGARLLRARSIGSPDGRPKEGGHRRRSSLSFRASATPI